MSDTASAPMSSLGATTAAGGSAASVSIVIVWLLGTFHLAMPTEVALALAGMLAPILHAVAQRFVAWLNAAPAALPAAPPATPAQGTVP